MKAILLTTMAWTRSMVRARRWIWTASCVRAEYERDDRDRDRDSDRDFTRDAFAASVGGRL